MNLRLVLVPAVLAALLATGCQLAPATLVSAESAKYSIESTGKFVPLDPPSQEAVTCTGLQERLTATGNLEVVANLRNRTSQAATVEVRCVFKDSAGFTTGDETPWRTLQLGGEETEALSYAAANNRAKKYSILVRTPPPAR